jgi:hypothetical protein
VDAPIKTRAVGITFALMMMVEVIRLSNLVVALFLCCVFDVSVSLLLQGEEF